jgi:hypothetical protein
VTGLLLKRLALATRDAIRVVLERIGDAVLAVVRMATALSRMVYVGGRLVPLRELLFLLALGLGILSGLRILSVVGQVSDPQGQVLGAARIAYERLQIAEDKLYAGEFQEAQLQFQEGANALAGIRRLEEDITAGWGRFLSVLPLMREGRSLIHAGENVYAGAAMLSEALSEFKQIKLSEQGLQGSGSIENSLARIKNLLQRAHGKFRDAQQELPTFSLVRRAEIEQVRELLGAGSEQIRILADLADFARQLLAGRKTILFVFQNTQELRPTGGFFGTYALVKLHDGKITALTIDTVYNPDGQLRIFMEPPLPIRDLGVERWGMRDANFFADFPTSAGKIVEFAEREGLGTPDLVVAITPRVVEELLDSSGPLTLPVASIELTRQNFLLLTEHKQEVLMRELFPVLLSRLGSSDRGMREILTQKFPKFFAAKDILLYSPRGDLQETIADWALDGGVRETPGDFLHVNVGNYGVTKTDHFVAQEITHEFSVTENGTIRAEVHIKRRHEGPPVARPPYSGENRAFIRVYVPLGSRFLGASGFDQRTYALDRRRGFQEDSDLALWRTKASLDLSSKTIITEESGKTVFANWIVLAPGQEKTATVTYELPFRLTPSSDGTVRYSLLVQKQPGVRNNSFRTIAHTGDWTLAWVPQSAEITASGTGFQSSLDTDAWWGMVLER